MRGNCVVAQSGGPTAVINASVLGVIEEARVHQEILRVLGSDNGIMGILQERLFDLGSEEASVIKGLGYTPSAALGTCRYKVKKEEDLARILEVFKARDIRYFFYVGGNDSQDTASKVNELAQSEHYDLRVIGVPKTVDNDLPVTDHCPGYGSVIKYLATMIRETGLDTEASYTSDPVNVIESIGRNTGWIAGGAALARQEDGDAPHIIMFPEVALDENRLLGRLEHLLTRQGRAVVLVSEGLKFPDGGYVAEQKAQFLTDTFGHVLLGGAGSVIRDLVQRRLHVKARLCNPSIILRNGAHVASRTDRDEAYAVGRKAVQLAAAGVSGRMVTLTRISDNPYRCDVDSVELAKVRNQEKPLPRTWLSDDGYSVGESFLRYARPLIQGAVEVPTVDGLPHFVRLKKRILQ